MNDHLVAILDSCIAAVEEVYTQKIHEFAAAHRESELTEAEDIQDEPELQCVRYILDNLRPLREKVAEGKTS